MVAFKTQSAIKSLVMGTAALVLAGMGTTASAITYTGSSSITDAKVGIFNIPGTYLINFSITTDGTLGVLTAANFVTWNFVIDGPQSGDDFTYVPGNSVVNIFGSALTATASELRFNFADPNGTYFQFAEFPLGAGGERHFWCLETGFGCTGNGLGPANAEAAYSVGGYVTQPRFGLATIATANTTIGVPEPAAWALLIGGFGLVGGMQRRQRSVTA